jgi:predicted Fe-Mo cluster-binding NifX family protein
VGARRALEAKRGGGWEQDARFGGDMVVGITTWGERVSPVLDAAERLVVFRTAPRVGETRAVDLSGLSPCQRAAAIRSSGIDVLICGAATRRLLEALADSGMTVVPWVSGTVSEILQAFSRGDLDDERFTMPGCRRGRHGHRRRR